MREFNVEGPCDPQLHFTVMREALVRQGIEKVEKGKYFTIFAPRQAGKTTYFQLLIRELEKSIYLPIWISFEDFANLTVGKFYSAWDYELRLRTTLHDMALSTHISDNTSLRRFFDEIKQAGKAVVLIAEVENLICQYEQESGQLFQKKVVAKIYENTLGQPGLVNALCRELVEKYCTDRSKPVDMVGFRALLDYFLRKRIDKNISNIVAKAKQHKEFMLKVLFDESEIPYTIDDEQIKFLHVNGVIEDVGGIVDVPIPLYKNRLINAFRPLINGETVYFDSLPDRFDELYSADGGLNIDKLIRSYIHYVQRRGFRAFDTENLKESAYHYSFDGYINFFIKQLGGETFIEVPSSRGRIDALLIYQKKTYVIEIKRWSGPVYYQKGKRRLAAYAKSEGLPEGYYVVFSNRHQESDTLFEQEEIDGVKIYSYIVRTNFERPRELSS